jgi:hypothetical protein
MVRAAETRLLLAGFWRNQWDWAHCEARGRARRVTRGCRFRWVLAVCTLFGVSGMFSVGFIQAVAIPAKRWAGLGHAVLSFACHSRTPARFYHRRVCKIMVKLVNESPRAWNVVAHGWVQ